MMTAIEHCCEAGAVAYPENCPWHPPAALQEHETITACRRCEGRGTKRLRGAERVREAMGWPREEPDLPCTECRGRGVVIIDKAVLDERLKPYQEPTVRRDSRYAHLFDQPTIQLPKDFA